MSYIERGLAIAYACSGLVRRMEDGNFRRVEDVRSALKSEVPSADVVSVVHGEWIGHTTCSVCVDGK